MLTLQIFAIRLILDTTQPNFVKRIAKIAVNTTLDVVCACPIVFDEDEIGTSFLLFTAILIISAFAIIKDMNFHPRFDKPITHQKNQSSDGSPTVKRIRLISPPPTKSPFNKPTDRPIDTSKSTSDIADIEVSFSQYVRLLY